MLRAHYPEAEVLGSAGHVVLPGLINAHHHSNPVGSIQRGIPDLQLESWLLTLAHRRQADPSLATLLSAARLLRSGVTSVVDVHSGRGTPEAVAEGIQQTLRAYDEAGIRAALAVGVTEQSYLVWGEDEQFLASLPPATRVVAQRRLPKPGDITVDDYFAIFDEIWRAYQAHPRLALWFGPPGPQWCSDALLERIAAAAQRYDTGIQTHLLESIYEKSHGLRAYGEPTLLHLEALGVLSPRFSFAHGVWLSEAEIAVLASSGASLSHNPSSNLRLRSGIAPLNALLAAGVTVGLGLDGHTLNDDDDMFTEMRLALRLHRSPGLGTPEPTASDILRLATTGGARLLGAEARLGRLAPGYAADLVLVSLERVIWPWVAPETDPLELLLARVQAGDVETVLINGEVVLRDGAPTRFDVAAVGQTLAETLAATPFPREEAEMVAALLPYIEAYYQEWAQPRLEPYVVYNSRR
ncbi:MAG: amidohydrolase family protein [Ardenticatenaceae bacterium]|nr:amidohydrolase family protein [Ardenticatenaceae bacterium]